MTRTLHKLDARTIRSATKPGRLSDGGGLYLETKPAGTKAWLFIWKVGAKRTAMGLGSFPTVSWGEARKLAAEYRRIVQGELLSFTHAWEQQGTPGAATLVTVRFEDAGDKTRMSFHQGLFSSVADRDGHQGGWSECFERLASLLG